MNMEGKISFANYKNLSQEEIEKLPVKELAQVLHEAIKEWDKLNQRLNQDSTNSNRSIKARTLSIKRGDAATSAYKSDFL